MSDLTRSERLLALLVLQSLTGLTVKDKAVKLASVGLDNAEIAEMLNTTPQTVAQSLYESRRAGTKPVRRQAKSRKPGRPQRK